jgi:Rps23 Pro-64 3,4-dihydroxylase Tpa1-like proline 4-hydroxylase
MERMFVSESTESQRRRHEFQNAEPFNHIVIDNFLNEKAAQELVSEFPTNLESSQWYRYDNAIENKRALNNWDRFPKKTYQFFSFLNSPEFIQYLQDNTGIERLYPDIGLHGGGWHAHGPGGKLNVHLDYSIHPKLGLERKLNLILYLTPNWKPEWGGGLQLWDHDAENNAPKSCRKVIDNAFNRAVLFDTTQNSWHGLPEPIACPEGEIRRSIAVYYLTEPEEDASPRAKALFAPHKEQKDDKDVLELIHLRSGLGTANEAYRKKK